MASDNEASCASDPNFAVICSFLGCFGKSCGIVYPDIARLQEMLENTQEVSRELVDLHVKLLRKTRKTVSPEKWERALVKFCHTYSNQDGWELERFGYKKARIAVKLRLLKVLLETQFDLNQKFKNEVNKLAAAELRVEPLGRDKTGLAYWCQIDEECNVRVYREDLDEENWELVAKDREGIVNLINTLSNGEAGAIPINEDSNSLEISEKPIIDTGQVTTSPSLEDEIAQENGADEVNDKPLPNGRSEFEDEREHNRVREQEPDQDLDDTANNAENDEEDDEDADEEEEEEDDITNDESSKQITEEDDSQEMTDTPDAERCTASSSSPATNVKPLNAKVEDIGVKAESANHREATETSAILSSDTKHATTHHPAALTTSVAKAEIEESAPLKSIETPVITSSPLKLVNIAELKQTPEEKLVSPTASVVAPLNAARKHGGSDEATNPILKSLDKLSNKNSLPFADSIPVGHTKLSLKPIDQLAANLGRIQSEKLEKPSGPKSLEKIAESLARSGGILGNMANGEDDRLPQDFCARGQSEKPTALRGHRGMDLSTSPRGWESANEHNRPVDFSGIDLSSRKACKTVDLPSPGYRTQDFQHREMDLSTKKPSKPEMSYDARNMMIRNHAMVADLSKRQMAFGSYKMPYHSTARLPVKDEHRLPSYTILPDPSKLTTLRMNTSLKRPMENDDTQQEMFKRIRTDVLPIRSTMDKRSVMGGNWRDEVGEAIEEPMMMVQGEGSGSDCDAVNPTVGEAIEEPTIFFYGEGSGVDCETGNPGDDASTDNKESNESKSEADSAATTLSQNKVLSENEMSAGAIMSRPPVKLNRNYPQSSVSVNDNCQIVDSVQEKPKFKHTLGVQIITKSASGPVKRLSRWDVGKPEEKVECDSIISNEGDISLRNADDREHNGADQRLSKTEETSKTPVREDSTGANQDAKTLDGNPANADSETPDESARLQVSDVSSETTGLTEQKRDPEPRESVQCDSSTSPSQADNSQTPESYKNPEATIDSTDVQNNDGVFDTNSIVTCKPDASKATDNECKPNASPPRFFFGPNCVSYTSKSDEYGSVPSSVTSVQYGCVSSSKLTDDAACPCKPEDFDLTRTNNNSLKSNPFTSGSGTLPSENEGEEVEKIDGPSNERDQEAATLSSSTDPNESSDCRTTKSSVTQLQAETSKELSAQEDACAKGKEVEESDSSNLHTSTTSETVAVEDEGINDVSMTEEDAVDASSTSEPSLDEPVVSATVESPQRSTDPEELPVSADTRETSIERSDDVTSQLDNNKGNESEEPADDRKNEDDRQSADPDVGDQEKTQVLTSAHSSPVSSLEQNLEKTEVETSLEKLEDVKPDEPLDSASVEPASSRQADTLERSDPGSADESCDNQVDKTDNFSETDGQEDRSVDMDNERAKSFASSDADSTYVNYDKNSERTDVLSDVGLQDDGSGDSEDVKEKEPNDARVNDTLFAVDTETRFPVNSTVTSSESAEEDNKHRLVPTISSPDSACAQDSGPRESDEPAQTDVEKIEGTDSSSVTDKPSAFSVLPPTVPEAKEAAEETNLPNLVQSTSECADDVSENPSSCVDQDSNEGMVIDDPVSESSKEPEETATSDEQQQRGARSEARTEPETKTVTAKPCRATAESEIPEKPEVDAESGNNLKKATETDEVKTCDNDEQQNATIAEDVCEDGQAKEIAGSAEKSETATVAPEQIPEIETPNTTSQESSQEKVTDDNRQSLVANYNSDSNDDISDDVFESDAAQANDSKSDIVAPLERNSSEELRERSSVEECDVSSANLVSNVPKEQPSVTEAIEQREEKSAESKVSETSNRDAAIVERDVKINTCANECADKIQTESVCNNIEYSNDTSTVSLKKNELLEETDVSAADPFETSDAAKDLAASVAEETTIESESLNKTPVMTASHTERNKEHLNNFIDNTRVQDTSSVIEMTQKTADCTTPESVRDLSSDEVSKFAKSPFAEEELNAVDRQVAGVFHMREQHIRNLDEKLNVSFDAENIARLKNVNEHFAEELSIPCKRFKEDLVDYQDNRDNKWDAKEECLSNKPFAEGVSLPPLQMAPDGVAPLKTDNALTADKSHVSLEGSVSSAAAPYYPNSMSAKTEGVNNLDSRNNQNESFSVSASVNKITGNLDEKPPSVDGNEFPAFSTQETISEIGAVKSEVKKEASKRLIDPSDAEDVPPVKSKPSYAGADDKALENLRSADVEAPKSCETFNEIEKTEPRVEEEMKKILPAISTTQLLRNNFAMANDSAAVASMEDSKKIDLEVSTEEEKVPPEIPDIEMKAVSAVSDDSTGMDNEGAFNVQPDEADPLACTDDDTLKNLESASDASKISIRVKPASELIYEGWKLDGTTTTTTTEAPKISRKRRNSANESNSEDGGKQEDDEMMGGKRIKLRAKRMPDKELRKTVEESRGVMMSSEDEAAKCDPENAAERTNKDDDLNMAQSLAIDKKIRGRPRGRRRRGFRGGGRPKPKLAEFHGDPASEVSSGVHPDGTPNDLNATSTDTSAQKKRKKRKMVLGLEIGRDISLESESTPVVQDETPVRQSRRIAQLKIKEQADRRRIEEETMRELEEKKESEKKKRKKQKPESEEEEVIKEIEKEKKSKKKRRKRKKKKMLAKFNEANPWQSSSGSSSDEENDNEDEDEEEDIESEGSLLFKSDHEFSPESDLEKDQESEPLRRARTAQKAQSDVEEADDEYACQKCGKADHPEWILLCDSCDKGWHCSCLRPALMLIPEGDWFCPPCQHNLLVNKLRETVKTFDQLTKRHENEVLRKKRLAFVGISLDNVLHKGETQRASKGSKASSQESDNESEDSSSSASTSETTSSEESEPVYQLRERRCANTYKFNEYDDMINAAIQDEVEAVQGAGNQGRGKDIATIVNAEKEEAQAEALKMTQLEEDKDEEMESKPEKESDEEYKIENEDAIDEVEEEQNTVAKKLLARKKHRKLNSLDISSEDDPESDEDFKGTSSEEEEDFDDHITSSDESSFVDVKRRGRKSDSRPVRRSTRARMTRAYDDDFINDDSEESDRPKRKKPSVWGDSDSEDSDNSWRQRKKKSRTVPMSRVRTVPKTKGKKKKKRKRIIESDNQSENDEEEREAKVEEQREPNSQAAGATELSGMLDVSKQENNTGENNVEMKDDRLQEAVSEVPIPQIAQTEEAPNQKVKKDVAPKPKKTIRRKVIYGRLPDENRQEEEEILSRRTRGKKINYREEMDSEEEMKKFSLMMRKTGDSEDEFVVNEGDDMNDDGDKDSDSGDVYIPKKDALKFKNKSPKAKKACYGRSPGAKRKSLSDDVPKQRKKPGPKPGSKHRGRKKLNADTDRDMIAVMDNPIGDLASKMDENLSDNVGLMATTMSVASSFTGDVPEGSLTGLGAGELADLDDEQLEQMMDEEYGRRQLELAAIEIAKKKKKEEREAKKLEKARLKALEILAAERQRDPNAPEGTDGEVPKKKKRGRRSKAEILAEQMRRDGAPNLGIAPGGGVGGVGMPDGTGNVPHVVSPALAAGLTPETDRSGEGGHMPLMTGPDGQLFNPDGTPMRPKRRGRGKGKKTLALEAARAAEAAARAAEAGLIAGMGTDSNPEMKQSDLPNILPTPGSSTSGSAPSTPPASAVPTPGPPSTQPSNSQPVYPSLPPGQQSSVITRMLQSQPVSSSPQSFTAAAAAMGHKYFGNPAAGGQMMGGPRTGYEMQPRARIPSPYRQAGQSMPHFAAVRSGTPPMRMRVPGPQMYHTTHHPMDPSPSGGGPISISNRDRSSPLTPGGPAMIPPSAGSPLAKGGPTPPPPPPPYVRGGPPMARFAENPMGPRHQMPPFTNASPVNHNIQQPSPPPNRPPGNFSPYHPPPPPNYHYGAYPPPPPMTTADDAAAYQGSPYPAEHFSSPADNQPMQGPPQGPPPQSHPGDPEEGTGEFGGLVSYFSSQREDDLDS